MAADRSTFLYTPFYCEENIWHLCREPQFAQVQAKVIFISNYNRQCYFWYQRAASHETQPMCWDYHVIMLGKDDGFQIWDLDTRLPLPFSARDYLDATFMHVGKIDGQWDPFFKVVDAADFLEHFSSDRSHMLDASGEWLQPPPAWTPIHRPDQNNLQKFIDMHDTTFGVVMDLNELRQYLRG